MVQKYIEDEDVTPVQKMINGFIKANNKYSDKIVYKNPVPEKKEVFDFDNYCFTQRDDGCVVTLDQLSRIKKMNKDWYCGDKLAADADSVTCIRPDFYFSRNCEQSEKSRIQCVIPDEKLALLPKKIISVRNCVKGTESVKDKDSGKIFTETSTCYKDPYVEPKKVSAKKRGTMDKVF